MPDKLGPAVLLLHQCPFDRHSWNEVAVELANASIHVLAADFRGHGGSGGDRITRIPAGVAMPREKGAGDIDTMYAYLLSQKFIDKSRLAMAGAGCSATLAADAAAPNKDVKALVVLSGAASEPAKAYITQTPTLAVLGGHGRGRRYEAGEGHPGHHRRVETPSVDSQDICRSRLWHLVVSAVG